ncbi:MAG: alpha/beta hydrolase [Rhodanobacter sp.]
MAEPAIRHRHETIGGMTLHVAEAGDPGAATCLLCLHGWPESWAAFEPVMTLLHGEAHVVAIDLPGIGGSVTPPASGAKRAIADCVGALIERMDLAGVTVVGHDVGGMVAHALLRWHPGVVARAVVMNTAIPGVAPWDEVVANPHIWHFAFHAVPGLPETLVAGREAEYFAWFQRALSARPEGAEARARLHAPAYTRPSALRAGFDWYRAFEQDACDTRDVRERRVDTPVLYLRGAEERGIALDRYVEGLREAGVRDVRGDQLPGCGHFAPEEQPQVVAAAVLAFARR